MKLSQIPLDKQAIITKIDIPNQEVKSRLEDFGLRIGQTISCVKKTPLGGPKAFLLSHGIFAIDLEITKHVEIQIEDTQ